MIIKCINFHPIFVLFRLLVPPTLTMKHLRIMLNTYWTPLRPCLYFLPLDHDLPGKGLSIYDVHKKIRTGT